jgi:hypothetical protein
MIYSIKKSIIAISVGILFSFHANATNDTKPKLTTSINANQTILEKISFSNELINFKDEEKVKVVFTVNETGKVNLVIANTKNESIKNAIEKQFTKLVFENMTANNAYSIVFNFKKI